jgi:hypothetical protein
VNKLNINLQGANQLAYEMFDKITAFEMELRLWELKQLSNYTAHFPFPRTEKPTLKETSGICSAS